MTNRAALVFRQTLLTVLDISQKLARLLRAPEPPGNDLESRVLTYSPESSDERFALLQRRCSETSERIGNPENYCEGNRSSNVDNYVIADHPGYVPYAEGPARVFLYRDGKSNDSLAFSINKEMITVMQDVTEHKHILQKHEIQHNDILSQVLRAERAIEAAEEIYADAETEDTAQKAQKEVESQRLKLHAAIKDRDLMADRLRIFKLNVEFTKDTAHALFEQALDDANLLGSHNADASGTPCEAGVSSHSERGSQRSDEDKNENNHPDPDELFRKAAFEKLMYYTKDLEETQEQWDTWPGKAEEERELYDDLLARGEDVGTQSEFDRYELGRGMEITSYLVKVEKEQEQAREHAIALGAVDEDWGKPMYMNDPWMAESCTAEEEIAYQQTRNWGRVERWAQSVSNALNGSISQPDQTPEPIDLDNCDMDGSSSQPNQMPEPIDLDNCDMDGSSSQPDQMPEPTDLDDWDAKSINIGEDCISANAHDSIERRNIKLWQMMKGHK